MATKNKLRPSELAFFSLVKDSTLANPFSDSRASADRKIAGLFQSRSREAVLKKAVIEVRTRLHQLEQDNRTDINTFREPDRTILKTAVMFDFFHKYCDRFDQIIETQAAKRQTKQKTRIPFADDALLNLKNKGVGQDEALHLFSLCYQMRRAFFFIDKNIVGQSPCMTRFREALWNNLFTSDLEFYNQYLWNRMEDFSTLIIGETGSGKGTAANAIGRSGFIPFDLESQSFVENFTDSFVSLNISQFPENLIESELFGHRKGSFTGAIDDHQGIFSRCSPYGAIFLDEIGEVSVPIQIKLLKVLEERAFSPIGSRETHQFKGRIITATNRSFTELQDPAILRRDFYYRLCSDIIVVPPLRQRIKENPEELDHLLINRLTKMIGTTHTASLDLLREAIHKQLGEHYDWPGNVRELEQTVRRILLNREGRIIREMGKKHAGPTADTSLAQPVSRGEIIASDLVKAYCYELYEKFGVIGEVARRTQLDRRTVKKYCDEWAGRSKDPG